MSETLPNDFLRPLHTLPVPGNLLGILTDIDDTLTTDGVVPPHVVDAMHQVRAAGLRLIPITGRPCGWSEPFARTWPVDAIVAENGAVALRPTPAGTLEYLFQQDESTRSANHARMQAVLAHIETSVAGARRASDSPGRLCDIAIDHSEHTHLPPEQIRQCVELMCAAGMNATVSSIHINGWFGSHDKLQGARWMVHTLFGLSLGETLHQWVYIGDSTNDQRMFEALPLSVGVANIARFVPQLQHLPHYVTQAERGDGFAELVRHILAARQRS